MRLDFGWRWKLKDGMATGELTMSERCFMGIDPGRMGGLAVLRGGKTILIRKMPETEGDLATLIGRDVQPLDVSACFVEKAQAMPDQGVVSTFTFGRGMGVLVGLLLAHFIPFEEVSPQTWLKILGIPTRTKAPRNPIPGVEYPAEETRRDFKNRLKATAQKAFPGVDVTLAISDALLIAKACERMHVW